jgi:hypothetical protein
VPITYAVLRSTPASRPLYDIAQHRTQVGQEGTISERDVPIMTLVIRELRGSSDRFWKSSCARLPPEIIEAWAPLPITQTAVVIANPEDFSSAWNEYRIGERDLNLLCASGATATCIVNGVIGEFTHGPYQSEKPASWRERNLNNENGTKLRVQFIFDASTRAQVKRIACHECCSVTSLTKGWAASAERRIISSRARR